MLHRLSRRGDRKRAEPIQASCSACVEMGGRIEVVDLRRDA
jgi:hypothetical protein